MALDQSALLEVLAALRNADAADRIKQAAETIYQALGGFGVADPETAQRLVLPGVVGAGPSGGPVPVRRGDGGLPARHLDPQGR
jgi:hypothetical protein